MSSVLIVDDDAGARRLYGAFLRSKGMEVHEADSGIAAVQRVEQHSFELVVMDLDMPGIDGWMAISLIRARLPDLPMVILTAMSGRICCQWRQASWCAALAKRPSEAPALMK